MPRVLVVEDEPALSRMLGQVLDEEGFEVRLEATGDRGLATALAWRPAALILDLALPGMDGIDLCRELRARRLPTKVIMLTARDSVPDRVRGLNAGADDYVVKPFAIEELLARLRAQLRGAFGAMLRVGDLTLTPDTLEVRRGDRRIQLSAKEFRLLELFMRHPQQVLARQQILDQVWGYEAAPSSNVVDLYVHYLRAKVDEGEPHRMIHTVRSVGYVLRP